MISRGQIWWVDLGEPRGSEPAFEHPVLVIQRDEVNASRIQTVVVCVLTSNRALGRAPGNTLLPRKATGLSKDSVVNASQILTLNKVELERLVGAVPATWMDRVDAGLRWFMGFE